LTGNAQTGIEFAWLCFEKIEKVLLVLFVQEKVVGAIFSDDILTKDFV
jgi:hypothetical protein